MRVKELLNEWASTARINNPVMSLNLQLPLARMPYLGSVWVGWMRFLDCTQPIILLAIVG